MFKQDTAGPLPEDHHPRLTKIVCELKSDIEPVEVLLNGLVELGMGMGDLCMVIPMVEGVHLGGSEVGMGNGKRTIRGNLMLKGERGRRGI